MKKSFLENKMVKQIIFILIDEGEKVCGMDLALHKKSCMNLIVSLFIKKLLTNKTDNINVCLTL